MGIKNNHSESELQRHCFLWFRYQYPKLWLNLVAVPNGGKRSHNEAAIMNGEGVVAGVADAILFVPSKTYHTLCIEFKRPDFHAVSFDGVKNRKTYQTIAQKTWQEAVEATGNKYIVVRSLDEFMKEINDYLSTD